MYEEDFSKTSWEMENKLLISVFSVSREVFIPFYSFVKFKTAVQFCCLVESQKRH